jgi:Microtubule-binding protein involved in cell cycle control
MAKYQDNLEFGQWMKRFYELKFGTNHNGYDAQGRRGKTEVDFGFVGGSGPKESKKTKTKEEASHATLKKARMSDVPTITEKNKENVTTSNCLKLEDYGKVKTERDNLREKLRNIEDILSSTQDDTLIVKTLKEYLGISNNTKLELSGSKQH